MGEPTVPKRRRLEPEPTAGSASGVPGNADGATTETASHMPGNADGATTETEVMLRKRAIRMAKDLILVSEIRRVCHDRNADPTETIRKIQDVLAGKTDTEDEAQASGPRMMLPAEDVEGCDQQ